MSVVRIVVAIAVLGLGIFVAVAPAIGYSPQQRAVLYLLISLLPAILSAGAATAKFEMKLAGFAATAAGSAALLLIVLLLLNREFKPDLQIAVFHLYTKSGRELVGLEREGVVKLTSPLAADVTKYISKNTLVVIFPEQIPNCKLRVQPDLGTDKIYSKTISYTGPRQTDLFLEKDLIALPAN